MRKDISRIILSAGLLATAFAFSGCGKGKETIPTIENSLFDNSDIANSYFVLDNPNSEYKIGIGLSAIATADRTITFTVSSPTGAVEGEQYNLGAKTITIPKGEVRGEISVKGLFDGFPGSRRDTLVFQISGGDVPGMKGSTTYTLVLQKFCEVDLDALTGEFTCQDYYQGEPDGPSYTVEISKVSEGDKEGVLSVVGLWGAATPCKVELKWPEPGKFSTNVPTQQWFVHSQYGQTTIKQRGSQGTFSSCDNFIRIDYLVSVSIGNFGETHSVLTKN